MEMRLIRHNTLRFMITLYHILTAIGVHIYLSKACVLRQDSVYVSSIKYQYEDQLLCYDHCN